MSTSRSSRGVLVVLLLGLLLGARGARYPLVYEDAQTVAGIHAQRWPFQLRPLTMWSWQAQAALGGGPQSWHLGNVAIHLANGWLVAQEAAALGVTPWLAAGLFVLHPMAIGTMTYVTSRPDLLATMAVLGSLWACRRRSRWGVVLVALALLAACAAKEAAVVGLLLIPWTLPDAWRTWLWGVVGTILVGVIALVWYLPSFRVIGHQAGVDWLPYAATQAAGAWGLLWRTVLPMHLTIEHDWWSLDLGFRYTLLYFWVLGGIVLIPVRRFVGAWALGWIWIAMIPRLLQRVPMSTLTEQQWYLMLVGGAIGLALVIDSVGCWLDARLQQWLMPQAVYPFDWNSQK